MTPAAAPAPSMSLAAPALSTAARPSTTPFAAQREPATAPPAGTSPEPFSAPASAPSGATGGSGPAPPGAVALQLAVLSLAAALLLTGFLSAPTRWRSVLLVSLVERPG